MKRMALLIGLIVVQPVSGEALCELCPDPTEGSTTLSVGGAAVDGVDAWRGSRLPWVDDGAFSPVDVDYRSASPDGYRLDSRLAIDSETDFFWDLDGARQGSWAFDLTARGYGIRDAGGARTPYDGAGGDNLVLPQLWTPGSTTDQMPDLGAALRPVRIGVDHRDTDLGLRWRLGSRWHLNARVSEQKVEGERATGAVIGTNERNGRAAILPAPVDRTTHNFAIEGDYAGDVDTVSLALRFSEFRNEFDRLGWDNAYSEASRAPRGAMALAPDNRFMQLDLSGAHRFSPFSQLSFQLAYSQSSQNQDFEPYTANPLLPVEPLPRDSLDGELDTWVAAARFTHRFDSELAFDLDYRYEDLDNATEQESFGYVIGDFRPSFDAPRTNLGYDFTRHRLGARLAYPLTPGTRLQGGVDVSRTDRSDREVEHADDLAFWGKIQWRFLAASNLSLRAERGRRRGDDYGVVEEIQPPNNPLMRRYSLADQDRWTIQATASHPLSERLTLGAQVRTGRIDYPDTRIGLSDTDQTSVSLDLSYSPDGAWSASLFTGYDRFDSTQFGSAAFAEPDWEARIKDSVISVGGALNWHPLEGRWESELELSTVDGQSDISVNRDPFPELGADLLRFVYRGRYQFNDALGGTLELWYERYEEGDWALQGVGPASVGQVLSFGEDARDHEAVAGVVSLRYAW